MEMLVLDAQVLIPNFTARILQLHKPSYQHSTNKVMIFFSGIGASNSERHYIELNHVCSEIYPCYINLSGVNVDNHVIIMY